MALLFLLLIALAAYVSLARNTSRVIAGNRALFEEFHVVPSLRRWVWLYPIPIVLGLIPVPALQFLVVGAALGAVFFIPGIVSAVRTRARFQTAGTDRVDPAQKAADHAVLGGVLGVFGVLIYTIAFWALARG
jgi:hypothetical protein